jgi:hypothetical protein
MPNPDWKHELYLVEKMLELDARNCNDNNKNIDYIIVNIVLSISFTMLDLRFLLTKQFTVGTIDATLILSSSRVCPQKLSYKKTWILPDKN